MPYTAHHHRPRPEHNASNPPRPRSGRYRRRQTVQNRLPLQNYPETDPTRLSMTVPFTLISGLDYAALALSSDSRSFRDWKALALLGGSSEPCILPRPFREPALGLDEELLETSDHVRLAGGEVLGSSAPVTPTTRVFSSKRRSAPARSACTTSTPAAGRRKPIGCGAL